MFGDGWIWNSDELFEVVEGLEACFAGGSRMFQGVSLIDYEEKAEVAGCFEKCGRQGSALEGINEPLLLLLLLLLLL